MYMTYATVNKFKDVLLFSVMEIDYDLSRFLWEQELLWPASTKATIRYASRYMEMAQPIR